MRERREYGTHERKSYFSGPQDDEKRLLKMRRQREMETQMKAIHNVKKSVIDLTKENVNTNKYMYSIYSDDKKIEDGIATVNITISSKHVTYARRNLSVLLYRDEKTYLMTVMIVSVVDDNVKMLYSNTDRYPIGRLEKFLPTIIRSTESIIDKKVNH